MGEMAPEVSAIAHARWGKARWGAPAHADGRVSTSPMPASNRA